MFTSFNARAIGLSSLGAEITIAIAAEVGFEGVDLMVRDLVQSGIDPRLIRSMMDDRGIQGGAFPFPVDWRNDEATFEREIDTLPPILEAARTLGLTRTGTWVMPELPDRTSIRADVVDLHIRRLGRIARLMSDYDIRLGLEVIGVDSFRSGRAERFVASFADLSRELSEIWTESASLGILLDAFHLYASDEPIDAGLSWGIGTIVWAHVADLPAGANPDRTVIIDANRGLPGDHGAVDVRSFLSRLANDGYDGPVTVEPLANCQTLLGLTPRESARRVKQALDLVWPAETLKSFSRDR